MPSKVLLIHIIACPGCGWLWIVLDSDIRHANELEWCYLHLSAGFHTVCREVVFGDFA